MQKQPIANLYLSIILLLVGFGMVMVYSASSVAAGFDPKIQDPLFFVKRQGIFLCVGLAAMFLLSRIDYRLLKRFALPIYGGAILLLLMVIFAGTEVNNAKRWIKLGPLTLQPSEVAKLAVVIMAAWFATKHQKLLPSFKWGFLPACCIVMPLSALIIVQPDLGTSVFVATLGFIVLLAGGVRLKHVALVAAVMMPLVVTVMFFKFGHVQDRILVFMDPEADRLGKGHQIYQSMIALGSGGFTGVGLGNSTQKLFFLPEESTDFIFAILTEELGFLGAGFLIFLFAALVYAGNRVSKHAPDRFGALLALGITTAIALQAAMNIAVVTASVPTKGISLPFISYGGTGLVVYLAGAGIVLSVARQALPRRAVRALRAKEALQDIEINELAEEERRPDLQALAARLSGESYAYDGDEDETEEHDESESDARSISLDSESETDSHESSESINDDSDAPEALLERMLSEGEAEAEAAALAGSDEVDSSTEAATQDASDESGAAKIIARVRRRRSKPKVRRSDSMIIKSPNADEQVSVPYTLSMEPPKRSNGSPSDDASFTPSDDADDEAEAEQHAVKPIATKRGTNVLGRVRTKIEAGATNTLPTASVESEERESRTRLASERIALARSERIAASSGSYSAERDDAEESAIATSDSDRIPLIYDDRVIDSPIIVDDVRINLSDE